MDITTFEKENNINGGSSFMQDDALSLKQKIEKRKHKQKKSKIILGSLISLVLVLVAFVSYSQYKLYVLSRDESATGATTAPKTGEEIVKALSRHILIPAGIPQIAEVQDAARLRETQAFFKDAENGDVVVVYETTIFVYRPSKDIVVAAGDISGAGQVKP